MINLREILRAGNFVIKPGATRTPGSKAVQNQLAPKMNAAPEDRDGVA